MATVEEYIARMRALAAKCDDFDRFYLFLDDEQLNDIEQEMLDAGTALDLLPAVAALYREWREQMGEERWQALLAYDEQLGDANRSWLLGELDAMAEEMEMSHVGQ